MIIEKARVESLQILSNNNYLIKVYSPSIAAEIKPGQFCNIKVSNTDFPLLRRPFSICDVEGNSLFFIFDIHGEGTKLLAKKQVGEELDILGPLGNGFDLSGDYKLAIIIGGGIGAAPFPFLIKSLPKDKEVICFIGGRTYQHVIKYGMKNIFVATDDGSEGYHGTIIDFFKKQLPLISNKKFRIFACGPNPMLKSLQELTIKNNFDSSIGFDCQISVECAMACGFGICQGCPIQKSENDGYYLVCKDGPIFDAKAVIL